LNMCTSAPIASDSPSSKRHVYRGGRSRDLHVDIDAARCVNAKEPPISVGSDMVSGGDDTPIPAIRTASSQPMFNQYNKQKKELR
jgi:hypothetical protein